MILPEEDYRDIIANPGWTYTIPAANPSEYPQAAVTAPAARRGQIEAEWTRLEHNHLDHAGVCDGARELIVYGAGEDAVVALKKRFTGYSTVTPRQMISHLRDKTCTKMTMLEKDKFKREGYEKAGTPRKISLSTGNTLTTTTSSSAIETLPRAPMRR